ncbi:MAG: condensation protein, partial [Gemmatimonadetes bacterium]|nr:condensation protein [Gemmatimonadota bacterium]NIV25105.1 condensation protein [Gemmatimonadota bacterium]NIW74343.1 condensation protein [Gemmatimonadota bacterium]
HIVSDAWSRGILIRELAALYEAFAARRPSPLAELPIRYADYAHWQREWLRGEMLVAEMSYWKEQLSGAPELL